MGLGQSSARLQKALRAARQVLHGLEELGDGFEIQREELRKAIESAAGENLLFVVVGSAKRGKSTLINGLLGRKDDTLAPIGRFPATNVVSVFRYAQSPKVEVHFEEDERREPLVISEHLIREYACEDRNPSNGKHVGLIDIAGPFAGIDPRTMLADLPGADNAQGSGHTQTLFAFLPRADAIIFLTAADEPINAAEQALLKHVVGLGLSPSTVMFVVNKRDYVRLGELDDDELSEGIAHNRRVIEAVGFPSPAIHVISAKDYLEGKQESGVDGLVAAMQSLVEQGRLTVIGCRLEERIRRITEQVRGLSIQKLELAKSSTEQLEARRKELVDTKRSLERGRHDRQARFLKEWRAALEDLCTAADRIEGDLRDRYKTYIEGVGSADLKPLLQTVHSDVHLAVRERIAPELDRCNHRLEEAQMSLMTSAGLAPIGVASKSAEPQPAEGSFSSLMSAMKVASAGLPATATGAGLLAAPGIVGSIIGAAAPSVAVTWWNPLTWVTGILAFPGAAAATAAQSAAVTVLGTIAAPLSLACVGYAAYRSYRVAKNLQAQDRNKLKLAVYEMIEGMCRQVKIDARGKSGQGDEIVAQFHALLSDQIAASENELDRLIRDRPSDADLGDLERLVAQVGALELELDPSPPIAQSAGRKPPWLPGRSA